jgi:hypothetical protein
MNCFEWKKRSEGRFFFDVSKHPKQSQMIRMGSKNPQDF